MAMFVDGRALGQGPQPLTDHRVQLRREAELRLSGSTVEAASCNPVDLRVPSFSRVTNFDFEDDSPVVSRVGRRVDDNDDDW